MDAVLQSTCLQVGTVQTYFKNFTLFLLTSFIARVPRTIIWAIQVCPERCLVSWSDLGQPYVCKESMETSLMGWYHIQRISQRPEFPEDYFESLGRAQYHPKDDFPAGSRSPHHCCRSEITDTTMPEILLSHVFKDLSHTSYQEHIQRLWLLFIFAICHKRISIIIISRLCGLFRRWLSQHAQWNHRLDPSISWYRFPSPTAENLW